MLISKSVLVISKDVLSSVTFEYISLTMRSSFNYLRIFGYLLLIFIYSSFQADAAREKRFIQFPPKTNVVMTMSLLKLLPTETILNTLTEVDVLFPVPIHPYHDVHPRKKREIERNIVYTGLKDAYESFGMEGESCLRRLVCEVRNSLADSTEEEENLLKDIFNIVFDPKGPFGTRVCNSKKINDCKLPSWF